MTGVLWLPEDLELVVLALDFDITVKEAQGLKMVLEERISVPAIIVTGLELTIRRIPE